MNEKIYEVFYNYKTFILEKKNNISEEKLYLLVKYGYLIDPGDIVYIDEKLFNFLIDKRGGFGKWENTLVKYDDVLYNRDYVKFLTFVHYLTVYGKDLLELLGFKDIETFFPYERTTKTQIEIDKEIIKEIKEIREDVKKYIEDLKKNNMMLTKIKFKEKEGLIKEIMIDLLYSNKNINENEKVFIKRYYNYLEKIDIKKIKNLEKQVLLIEMVTDEIDKITLSLFIKYLIYIILGEEKSLFYPTSKLYLDIKNDENIRKKIIEKKDIIITLYEKIPEIEILRYGHKYAKILFQLKKIINIPVKNRFFRGYNKKIREYRQNNEFSSLIEKYIKEKNIDGVKDILKKYPNYLVEYFSKLIVFEVSEFYDFLNRISNKLLIRLFNYISGKVYMYKNKIEKKYLVLPNGKGIEIFEKHLDDEKVKELEIFMNKILEILRSRHRSYKIFIKNENIWDEYKFTILNEYKNKEYRRFNILDMDKKMRIGIFWENGKRDDGKEITVDYDLGVGFIDENGNVKFIGWNGDYYDEKDNKLRAIFSGDVTDAPIGKGASEFIDVDISKLKKDFRYIVISIFNFSKTVPSKLYCGFMNINKIDDVLDKNDNNSYFIPEKLNYYIEYNPIIIDKQNIFSMIIDLKEETYILTNIYNNLNTDNFKKYVEKNSKTLYSLLKYKYFLTINDIFNIVEENNINYISEEDEIIEVETLSDIEKLIRLIYN